MQKNWSAEVTRCGDMDIVGKVISQSLLCLIRAITCSSKATAPSPLDCQRDRTSTYMVKTPDVSRKKLSKMADDNLHLRESVEDPIYCEAHYLTLIEKRMTVHGLRLQLQIGMVRPTKQRGLSRDGQKQA
jgi:hypothetical protein